MTTQAYDDFIAAPTRQPLLLAEMEPKQELRSWTLTSGRTNTYEISWSSIVREAVEPGGFYRKLLSINENNIAMTQTNSVASVEATTGTWYFDEGADKLYAHVSTGGDPDALTTVFATFRIHLCNGEGIALNGIYYEPRLSGSSEVVVEESQEDLFFGQVKRVSSGKLALLNGDGLWDTLADDWTWRDSFVNLKFGAPGMTIGDFEAIGEYQVEDFISGFQEVAVPLRDINKSTFRPLPPNSYDSADFPNMDLDDEGKVIPLLYGSVQGITPVLIDSTNQMGTYMVADPDFEDLYAIDSVYDDGTAIDSSHLDISLTGCTFTILSTYAGATPTVVTCDAKGPAVFGDASETSTDYLKYYGEGTCWLYCRVLGLPSSKVDSDAAKDVDSRTTWPQGLYIDERKPARQYVRELEIGVLGRTVRAANGKITPKLFLPGSGGEDLSLLPKIEDPDITDFAPDPRIRVVFSKAVITYGENPTTGATKSKSSESLRTKYLVLNDRDEERVVPTALTQAANADTLASRVKFLSSRPATHVKIEESGISLMNITLQRRVLVTVARAPSSEGRWTEKIMEVGSVIKTFSPEPRVEVVLNDLQGVGEVVGIWTESAGNWSTATGTEKTQFGFWSDSEGNPARKVWW